MSMIYLDNAATTPVRPEVLKAMKPYYEDRYGNPSGIYRFAAETKAEVERVRKEIADTIQCMPEEIFFTSGGTESDNWALKSAVLANKQKGKHIITTKIEHHAILHSCEALEKEGCTVTYLGVDELGRVSPEELEKAIRTDTVIISVMYANNEVGMIQPVKEIGVIAKKHNILFHTDAVQAYGHLPINVKKSGIDMLSASGHKLNGPKGIGFLYINRNVSLPSFIHGGKQEAGRRAGTENVAGIIGLGKAAELACLHMDEQEKQSEKLRDYLFDRLQKEIPFCRINGGRKRRLAGNCSVSFQFIEGASLLVLLDDEQICASAGSACSSGSTAPSHVLSAMGIPDAIARGSIRLSVGYGNTKEEMDRTVECIKRAVKKLRENSPEYEDYMLMQAYR